MTEAMQFIEKALHESGQTELCFRIPPLLHEALELYRIDNHYPNSLRELYNSLVQEEFFNAYRRIFEAIENETEAYQGFIQASSLSSFGVDSERYREVGMGTKKSATVLAPSIFREACKFINIALGWHQSPDIVFRTLTEKILIVKLSQQLDYLLETKKPRLDSQQLSMQHGGN